MYTQEYIDNLPHYTVAYAAKLGKKGREKIGLKHFHSENACGKCRCYIRVCSDQLNRIFCAGCAKTFKGLTLPYKESKLVDKPKFDTDPKDKPFSVATIKYGLSHHNQKVEKASKDGWRLPTVFSANIK